MGSLCFSYKTHVEYGVCARPFQPTHLSGVPEGLEPVKREVACNVCVFLIKFYIQKSASETKKKKVSLSEQKEFLFLQAMPGL